MPRFFADTNSSSESSSDEEELYSEEEEEEQSEEEGSEKSSEESSDEDDGKTGAGRFLRDVSDESESDEDRVTVVKSAKDKRFEELEATTKAIENAEKINDWAVVSTEFDKMIRQVPTLVRQNDGKTPKPFIKAISELEFIMLETFEKQKVTPKKMNATNTRGLNAVRQRLRKIKQDYGPDIERFRADPGSFMQDEVVEEVMAAPKRTKKLALSLGTESLDDDEDGFTVVGAGGKPMVYTSESILKHLRTIVDARGRKNTDRMEQIRIMERLFDVANSDYHKVRVLLTIISTRFDLITGTANQMSQEQWRLAENEFRSLLEVLETNRSIVVIENAEEWDDDDKLPVISTGETFKVPGSITSLIERLDDELTRVLQNIDPHTADYVERLTDETALYTSITRAQLYVEWLTRKHGATQECTNRIVIRRLEHLYFKPLQVVKVLEESSWKAIPSGLDSDIASRNNVTDVTAFVATLCAYLFKCSEGITRARAMLCQIYHLALHDHYYKARDMMLMSHLQETISNFDVNTQILFNRTLVQVGLCAFRAGLIFEAQTSLQEICGSNRQKELLAQGVQLQRYSQISPEQERLERQRQLPFHMHINLELLECVYLTCSMLLEIPLLAQVGSSPDIRKRVISKTYRRLLEYHERQIFTGPPENTRDHVMQASKALAAGEWNKAAEFIKSIKVWDLIAQPDRIKEMLSRHIQEEGLRAYLFTYAPFYDTLSINTLVSMFELPDRKISAIVSKMISHEELAAALDQVNSAIIFRKGVELSRLQSLALTLGDKASGLIEANEKTLEQRTQGMANAFERQGGRGGRGGARGRGRGGWSGVPRGQQFTGGALGRAIQA